MTSDMETILNKVRKICLDIEVFISYEYRDREVIQPLIKILSDRDYSVWTPESKINTEYILTDQISDTIIQCAYRGFYIIVISEESIKSSFVTAEFEFAFSQGAWIVPIVIGEPNIPKGLRIWIGKYQQIKMPLNPTKSDFNWVVDILDTVMKRKIANIQKQ